MHEPSGVTASPIDTDALREAVGDDRAGAVVTFAGVVRNHDHGAAVTGIEYVGHPQADALLKQIVADISAREGVHAVVAQHRVGHLDIGGVALFVAVATSHRREGFEAASDLVERVKEELPIWKKQFFTDGSHEWSQCP